MKLFLRSIIFFTVASFSPLAFGQFVDWRNIGNSTDFNTSTNWIDINGNPTLPNGTSLVEIYPGFTVTTSSLLFPNPGGTLNITIGSNTDQTVASMIVTSSFGSNTVPNGTLAMNFTGGFTLNVLGDYVVTGGSSETFTGNQTIGNTLVVGTANSPLDTGLVEGKGSLTLNAGTTNIDNGVIASSEVGNGNTGTLIQNSGSLVISGVGLNIGDGGTGTYTINSGAELDMGTQGAPAAGFYDLQVGTLANGIGTAAAANGTLTISGTLLATNDSTRVDVGSQGTGTINQNVGSTVSIDGAGSSVHIGELGGTGTYNLGGGTLDIGTLGGSVAVEIGDNVGLATPSTGHFIQAGGTLTTGANTTFDVGNTGTGTYAMSGGTATFGNGLTVGSQTGSTGIVTQTGGTVTVNGTPLLVGDAGTGTYSLSGGTLTTGQIIQIGTGGGTGIFNYSGGTLNANAGLNIGATGTFNQLASLTITQPVTVAAGGAYNLLGGTLSTGGSAFTGAGNFNFAGGTVAVTGSTWNDGLNGIISNTPTIDTTGGNANLTGNLSGTGNLTIQGGGTVTVSGTGSGSWGANITQDSTFTAASAASLAPTGALKIGSGSTLNILDTGNPTDTFAGSIANVSDPADPGGTAQFNTGTNKLILSGTVNLDAASATTIGAGGSLQVNKGTISNVNGSAGNAGDTFDVGDGTTTGTVRLLGNNIIPNVVVNTKSTLLASNITGSVTNHGTLGSFGTNLAPAPILISGNLTSDGTLTIHTGAAGTDSFGTLANPLTTATLSGTVNVIGFGTRTVAIVNTSGGVTATIGTAPGDLSTNPATALFSATLTNNGNQIILNTVQNALGGFARTPNEGAVAGVLDPVINGPAIPPAFAPVLTGLNRLSASQLPQALESLTPESLQYSRIIAFENSTFLTQRMNAIDADIRAGLGGLDSNAISVVSPIFNSSLGRSMKNLMASNGFHDTAPNGVNYYPGNSSGMSDSAPVNVPESSPMPGWDPSTQTIVDAPNPYLATQHPNGDAAPGFTEFISGDIILADLNQDLGAANAPSTKASYKAADATAGIAYRFNSHFSAGVLFDYNHTDAKTDGHGSRTLVDSYSPGIFATYFDHGFYANGLFAFGYNQYDNQRDINFLGQHANSSPEGQQYTSSLDVGYDFHPDKSWVVGPTLGATWTHLDINSFTETGASGANLAVDSQEADSVRSRLGGHVIFQTNTGDILLQPNITAVWQHEYLNNASAITSNFNDFSTGSFTINTTAPTRDSALLGVGLTATLSNSMIFYFNYMADVGANNYFAQSLMGGFKTSF